MAKTGIKNIDRLSSKQLRKMIELFGLDKIPDPLNYPSSFNYYVKLFKYLRENNVKRTRI